MSNPTAVKLFLEEQVNDIVKLVNDYRSQNMSEETFCDELEKLFKNPYLTIPDSADAKDIWNEIEPVMMTAERCDEHGELTGDTNIKDWFIKKMHTYGASLLANQKEVQLPIQEVKLLNDEANALAYFSMYIPKGETTVNFTLESAVKVACEYIRQSKKVISEDLIQQQPKTEVK